MSIVRLPFLKVVLFTFLGGCSALGEASKGDILQVLHRMEEQMQDSIRGSLSSMLPPYRIKFSHESSWILVRMEEEEELLRFGAAAVLHVSRVVGDRAASWETRARLSILLGHLGDQSCSPVLLETARRDSQETVRESAWIGLGLFRSPALAAGLEEGHPPSIREQWGTLWVMAMSGSAAARDQFTDNVANAIASEIVEPPKLTGERLLWVDEEQKHLTLRAKVTEENKTLDLDLWKMAHFRNLRVVEILVDALAFHDHRVQHMAYELLERDVADIPDMPSPFEFNLHALKVHTKWKQWWSKTGHRLEWDNSRKKYIAK